MSATSSTPVRLSPVSLASAGDDVRPILEGARAKYGFVPNLLATLANVPALLEGYLAIDAQFNRTSFSPRERQLILLTASVENDCHYCIAAHSTVAKGMLKVDADLVAAIREQRELPDAKLNALVQLVRELVHQRGHLSDATVAAFTAAGYRETQIPEALLGVAQKTMSNYFDHLTPIELDAPFRAEADA